MLQLSAPPPVRIAGKNSVDVGLICYVSRLFNATEKVCVCMCGACGTFCTYLQKLVVIFFGNCLNEALLCENKKVETHLSCIAS